ncbi:MAG: restriction endonuclease, partial [Cyanobacteria bacterium P01_B01_bin.77]
MSPNFKPIQKILFGSPGTGKSYQIREIAQNELSIEFDDSSRMLRNTVKTVFHPEYTYADFMGKLLPLTQGNSVIYKFYPGHFLRILGMSYKRLIDGEGEQCLLVIDELNRGNAAAIFGTVFQLLDREDDGWSSYEVDVSDMELVGLLQSMGMSPFVDDQGQILIDQNGTKIPCNKFFQEHIDKYSNDNSRVRIFSLLQERRINIPGNLSIIATINTSDESIYYLDSAFKRRWDWTYVDVTSGIFNIYDVPKELRECHLVSRKGHNKLAKKDYGSWYPYVVGLNEFIKANAQSIRRIEDKQIGWWFIKPKDGEIDFNQVKNKLMFYLWDGVFSRDRRPLEKIISESLKQDVSLNFYAEFL